MPDIKALKDKIADSGMTMIAISKKSGINRATIYNRLNGRGEWTASEMVNMSEALGLTQEEKLNIFLQ